MSTESQPSSGLTPEQSKDLEYFYINLAEEFPNVQVYIDRISSELRQKFDEDGLNLEKDRDFYIFLAGMDVTTKIMDDLMEEGFTRDVAAGIVYKSLIKLRPQQL